MSAPRIALITMWYYEGRFKLMRESGRPSYEDDFWARSVQRTRAGRITQRAVDHVLASARQAILYALRDYDGAVIAYQPRIAQKTPRDDGAALFWDGRWYRMSWRCPVCKGTVRKDIQGGWYSCFRYYGRRWWISTDEGTGELWAAHLLGATLEPKLQIDQRTNEDWMVRLVLDGKDMLHSLVSPKHDGVSEVVKVVETMVKSWADLRGALRRAAEPVGSIEEAIVVEVTS